MIRRQKSGFTLMELMVYMAILGIIVIVAGRAFSDSTKFRIRTQNILKATQEAENVATLFKADVAQTGAKSSKANSPQASTDAFYVSSIPTLYILPNPASGAGSEADSSSYTITHNKNGQTGMDELVFKRMRYNADGTYSGVEEITWVAKDKVLTRSCKTIEGTGNEQCPDDNPATVEIADHVEKFVVKQAKPTTVSGAESVLPSSNAAEKNFRLIPRYNEEDFMYLDVSPAEGGTTLSLTGFAPNYDFSSDNPQPLLNQRNGNQVFLATNSTSGDWKSLCKKVTLVPNVEYEISFAMPYSEDGSRMFCPGRDHMSVGFRSATDGSKPDGLEDFFFFPPTLPGASTGERSMRFTVANTIENVCLAFTFASYSPIVASGKIKLKDVALKKIPSSSYVFEENDAIAVADKKNVKALKLELRIGHGGKKDADGADQPGETGEVEMVIPIPSNGPRD